MTTAPQPDRARWPRPARGELLLLLLLTAGGVARIVSTYRVFNATYDEPVHLESGIEWLQFGRLTWNQMHPPLSRAFVALGPYLEGVRGQGKPDWKAEGVAELHSQGHYYRTLALARAGVLPFFVLAVWSTWWLARLLFGPAPALVAGGTLTLLPPVLAHAGLATTDMAVAGMMPVVITAGLLWLDDPRRSATLLLGAACGLAVLLKFSALVFVPACLASMLLVKLVIEPGSPEARLARWRRLEIPTLGVAGTAFLVLWAGYLFHLGTPDSIQLGGLKLGNLVPPAVARAPIVPAPEFWTGLITVVWYNRINLPSYVLGEVVPGGPWYFFPFAIGVKTPLAFLVLALLGSVLAARLAWTERRWRPAVPVAIALALLAAAMSNRIALGLRHLLPIYPVLSILVGVGTMSLWHPDRHRGVGRAAALFLGGWLLLASVRAHPDYLAAFNELASERPEHFLLNSDLDYGQDVGRLADTVRARGIDSLTVYLFSFRDDSLLSSPRYVNYPDWRRDTSPTTGWVAASALLLYAIPGIPWLQDRRPVAKVGKSIYLFYIPADTSAGPR